MDKQKNNYEKPLIEVLEIEYEGILVVGENRKHEEEDIITDKVSDLE